MVSAYPPRRCGVGSYAKASVERMREEGDHVVVLSPPDGEGDVRVPFGRGRPFLRAARMGPGFDLVQVQYQPSLYDRPGLSPSKVLTALSLLWLVRKRKQTEIVVHEVGRPKWWRPDHFLLHRVFARARLAFHTDAERRHLEKDWRVRTRFRLIDHAGGVRIATRLARQEARDRLSIGDHEILFLCAGFLHPDKAFERAVRAFPGPPGARLVVLGSVRDGEPGNARYARSLRDLCERTPGVALIEGYVSDEDFDAWIQAADRVVLPYRRSWSSGALARAQRLGTAAIVSDVGGLPEQAGPSDTVFSGDGALASIMARVVERSGPHGQDDATGSGRAGGSGAPGREPHDKHEEDWDIEHAHPIPQRSRLVLIGLILISVALSSAAQITLKHGMNQVVDRLTPGHPGAAASFSWNARSAKAAVMTPAVWMGLGLFGLAAVVWLSVLSRAALSFAYPFAALTYAVIVLYDFLRGEPTGGLRWGGVALIVAGIVLVSRTSPHG